jgi:hypothetical protein
MLERLIEGYESAFRPEAQGEMTDARAEMPEIDGGEIVMRHRTHRTEARHRWS